MWEKQFKAKKILFSQRFLWDRNVVSTPIEHDSSCLNGDLTSHESLQLM